MSASGAFAAWVELASGEKAYDYAEITGYALSHIAARASLSPEEIAVGRRAADWLVGRVQKGRLAARDGWDGDAVYLFDLGMIAAGLHPVRRISPAIGSSHFVFMCESSVFWNRLFVWLAAIRQPPSASFKA